MKKIKEKIKNKLRRRDIVKKAKEFGVNPRGLSKAELIHAIQRAEGNFDCYGTATHWCDQPDCLWRHECF